MIIAGRKGLQGLIATLDADNQPNRIELLRDARREFRNDSTKTQVATAIGQANPELEAWLLDDQAVKQALSLSAQAKVPSPSRVSDVKMALNKLIARSSVDKHNWRPAQYLFDGFGGLVGRLGFEVGRQQNLGGQFVQLGFLFLWRHLAVGKHLTSHRCRISLIYPVDR